MARSITVSLGGREYEIQALPIRQTRAWRQRLAEQFGGLAYAMAEASAIELTNTSDIMALVDLVNRTVIGSVDLVLDLLFEFAPVLAADRERIEAEAYDEEAIEIFIEVLKLAYPFGALGRLISSASGAQKKPT